MCNECNQYICSVRCPNYTEEEQEYISIYINEAIISLRFENYTIQSCLVYEKIS